MADKPLISDSETQSEREIVRQQLLEAGMLVTNIEIPEIPGGYTEEEIEAIFPIQLPPDAKTLSELLDDDRGDY